MLHKPHGWVILKFTQEREVFFKIFASWRGGYLDGDSWRLSSGSKELPSLSDCGGYWIWPQKSGSCYHLPMNGEGGMSFISEYVLKDILSSNKLADIGTYIEIISLDYLIN